MVHGHLFLGEEPFVSHRGISVMIRSAIGTILVGLEKTPQEYRKDEWNTKTGAAEFDHKSIKSRFNPPTALHRGGLWDRLLRTFNWKLCTVFGTFCLTDEILNTSFCLIEYELDARPLRLLKADQSVLGAITPNHVLFAN